MKSIKKFGKAGIAILIITLMLANMVAPLTVVGSDGAGTGLDCQYYVVKAGDTFASIARAHGLSVSDIRNANDLTAVSKLYTGQILKLPVATNYAESFYGINKISIDYEDADVKDVLSAIALTAGYTIVYVGPDDTRITLKMEDVSPIKAVDYATRLAELSYLKDGNTLFIGPANELNSKFIDSIVLAEYTLRYINAEILQNAISGLGLENVTIVRIDTAKSKIWISAYPKEVAKIKELIDILDTSTNIAAGSTQISTNFSPINLNYIQADEFNGLLATLGLEGGVTTTSKPYTLYTYVTGNDLADIMKIKAVVDTPAFTPASLVDENGNSSGVVNTDTTNNNNNNNNNTNNSNTNDDSSTKEETTILYARELKYVTRDVATRLLAELHADVEVFGRSEYTKMIYLYGKKSDVNKALDLLKNVIDVDSDATESFFVYTPVNSTVKEILSRATNLGLNGVTFYEYSNDELADSFMVFCKEGDKDYVKEQLDGLDGQNSNEVKWRPLESSEDAAILNTRIDTIKGLYPDAASLNYQVVPTSTLTGEPKYVLYVQATADKADYVKTLLISMDAA